MRFDRHAWVVAGALGLQAAIGQDYVGVSMVVTDANGQSAGTVCEPFDCTPGQLPITAGTTLVTEMYGLADQPYILFAGPPSPQCLSLPWVLGGITMDLPITIVDVGLVTASGLPNDCGLDIAVHKFDVPAAAPVGAQLVLQTAAWPAMFDMPAFSRGVTLTIG